MSGLMDVNSLGVQISASTTSARGAVPFSGATTARFYNPSGATAYFKSGDSTVTATSADMPIGAGVEVFSINPAHTHVAVILASGTGTVDVRFSVGGE